MTAHPDSLNDPIRSVCESLKNLNRDLGSMPGFKAGSKWHTDRVAERERLHTQLRALYAEQDLLLADRPDDARMEPRPGHPVPECFVA